MYNISDTTPLIWRIIHGMAVTKKKLAESRDRMRGHQNTCQCFEVSASFDHLSMSPRLVTRLCISAFLSYSGGILNNCLTNILHINKNDINEQEIIRRSSYYDFDQFSKLAKENKKSFSILSTNIQSVNFKLSELEAFIEELNTVNIKFSVMSS